MYCTVFVTAFVTTAKFYGMNNILLVRLKSSTLPKTLHLTKIQNLNIKSAVFFFLYKNLFFFVRLNRFLYIWVVKCKISVCRFLNH